MTATKEESPDLKAIKALIQAFFNSINEADTKALLSHFFPNANLTIVRQDPPLPPPGDLTTESIPLPSSSSELTTEASDEEKGKLTVVIRTTIENFVKLIEDGEKRRHGKPGPKLHETPDLDATQVNLDSLFACAWSPFKVTFDGVLHHYGTIVCTLGKVGGGEWKIEGLTQNYRRTPGWGAHETEIM